MSRRVQFLAMRYKTGRLRRILVVRADLPRRRATVKAMRAAGWPWWRIAKVLKVRRERVERMAEAGLWSCFDLQAMPADVQREIAHVRRRLA